MSFDSNVSVDVVTGAQAVDRAVFTIPLHLSTPTFPERVRTYASGAEAAADTLLDAAGLAAVNAHFAQGKHSPTIKVGRTADTPAAQVVTITVGGVPLEDEVYTVVVNAITTEYVAGVAPTISSVYTALDSAVTTDIAALEITVSGIDPNIILTADNVGEQFSYSVSVDDPPGGTATGTLVAVLTTANAGIGSDLDACLSADATWYGLTTAIHATPATNLINMSAASSWAQINKKIYYAQSLEATVLAATAGNDLVTLSAKNNSRTAYMWHHDDTELAAVAHMAYKFQADPDEKSTAWAYAPLSGISRKPVPLTSTQYGNINSQNGNYCDLFGGNLVAGMGVTTTGKKIDVWVTEDWLEARLKETYIQLLSDVSARNESIALNDKDMEIIPSNGNKILSQGVRVKHFNPGTTFIRIPLRSAMPAADVTARHVRVTAGGTKAGSVERITVTFTLLLV